MLPIERLTEAKDKSPGSSVRLTWDLHGTNINLGHMCKPEDPWELHPSQSTLITHPDNNMLESCSLSKARLPWVSVKLCSAFISYSHVPWVQACDWFEFIYFGCAAYFPSVLSHRRWKTNFSKKTTITATIASAGIWSGTFRSLISKCQNLPDIIPHWMVCPNRPHMAKTAFCLPQQHRMGYCAFPTHANEFLGGRRDKVKYIYEPGETGSTVGLNTAGESTFLFCGCNQDYMLDEWFGETSGWAVFWAEVLLIFTMLIEILPLFCFFDLLQFVFLFIHFPLYRYLSMFLCGIELLLCIISRLDDISLINKYIISWLLYFLLMFLVVSCVHSNSANEWMILFSCGRHKLWLVGDDMQWLILLIQDQPQV